MPSLLNRILATPEPGAGSLAASDRMAEVRRVRSAPALMEIVRTDSRLYVTIDGTVVEGEIRAAIGLPQSVSSLNATDFLVWALMSRILH